MLCTDIRKLEYTGYFKTKLTFAMAGNCSQSSHCLGVQRSNQFNYLTEFDEMMVDLRNLVADLCSLIFGYLNQFDSCRVNL